MTKGKNASISTQQKPTRPRPWWSMLAMMWSSLAMTETTLNSSRESLYAVQVGDLIRFADEQIKLVGDYQSAIAAKILEVFALFRGK